MAFEYKTVAAPERAKKRRGAKTRTERVALAFEDLLNEHGVDGWEYLRTDLLPVEERTGMFSRVHEAHRAVMVFRRPLAKASHGLFDRDAEPGERKGRTVSEPTALPPLPREYDEDAIERRAEPTLGTAGTGPDRLAR